jgi:hypothetical protein
VSFANPVSDQRSEPGDFKELLAWLVRHGALATTDAERLGTMAAERPEKAAAVLAIAQSARQLLWRVFNELADQRRLSSALLKEVNRELIEALPRPRIVAAKVGFRWDWDADSAEDVTSSSAGARAGARADGAAWSPAANG